MSSRSFGWRSPRRSRRPRWQTLDSLGSETGRAALRHIMTQARAAGLIDGSPADMAEQFAGLLWRDLLVSLLLGVAQRPNPLSLIHIYAADDLLCVDLGGRRIL